MREKELGILKLYQNIVRIDYAKLRQHTAQGGVAPVQMHRPQHSFNSCRHHLVRNGARSGILVDAGIEAVQKSSFGEKVIAQHFVADQCPDRCVNL